MIKKHNMKNLRPEVKECIKGYAGLADSLDDIIVKAFNITSSEYNYICKNATDIELDKFVLSLGGFTSKSTFSEKREALSIKNKYILEFNNIRVY